MEEVLGPVEVEVAAAAAQGSWGGDSSAEDGGVNPDPSVKAPTTRPAATPQCFLEPPTSLGVPEE